VQAQIDPYRRELLQFGYNGAFQGHPPISAYAFYYRNQPEFVRTNWTLRLAVSPTYVDSELGIHQALSDNTDVGLGLAGGGFADSYAEIRSGAFIPRESFVGHSAEVSSSIYHLFNPAQRIPLHGILRGSAHFSAYAEDDDTDDEFDLPDNRGTFMLRTGLRLGGREPVLFPSLAMELSVWYEGQFRTGTGEYGYDDRSVRQFSHQIWAEAALVYTLPELGHSFDISLSAGTSVQADRFSAYRLGALLPLVSEFPLSLPGYYYQELSADSFVLISGDYLLPLDSKHNWNLNFTAATAVVDYLDDFDQPGNSHTGVGGGVLYRNRSVTVMVGYAYGVNAIRSDGRGAHSIGILMQVDWGNAKNEIFSPATPNLWRGLQRVFGVFGR
jgi:hypothetical protein